MPTLSTLTGPCRYQQEIKKSRFLALAMPVDAPAQAMEFIREASEKVTPRRLADSLSHTMPTLSTLTGPCRYQQEIKKSRFLALAMPVDAPAQAMEFIREASETDASHHCWAYLIGQDYRFHDDGEPGGTAGRPILQAMESQGLDRVAVVVSRWYGGIKLGAGGLARAYGGTAAECLRLAEHAPIVSTARLAVHCGFSELPLLRARLQEFGTAIESEFFDTDGVTLHLQLGQARIDEARALITDITRGRSHIRQLD